jgi:hypothetical protein
LGGELQFARLTPFPHSPFSFPIPHFLFFSAWPFSLRLARLTGLDALGVSRRFESAKSRMGESEELRGLVKKLRAELVK